MAYKIAAEKKAEVPVDEKEAWKQLCAEKKAELWEEAFKKRRLHALYEKNKAKRIEQQLRKYRQEKEETEKMFKEVMDEVWWNVPEYMKIDDYYMDKYAEDDKGSDWKYKYYWWCSRLNFMRTNEFKNIGQPVRIARRKGLSEMLSNLGRIQDQAYLYLKPHIDEIDVKTFKLSWKQFFTKKPMWSASWKMLELANASSISQNQLFSVASAMLRDRYICSEVYMGRVSYLVGDIIITQGWNILRPCLENNLPWLTVDTVEQLHEDRKRWLKKELDEMPVYILWDTYLIKVKPNEWETEYYLVPTSKNFRW